MREQLNQASERRDHNDKHLQQLKLDFGLREQRLRVEIPHILAFPLRALIGTFLLSDDVFRDASCLLGLNKERHPRAGTCAHSQEAIHRSKVNSTHLSQAKILALVGTDQDQELLVLPRRPNSTR